MVSGVLTFHLPPWPVVVRCVLLFVSPFLFVFCPIGAGRPATTRCSDRKVAGKTKDEKEATISHPLTETTAVIPACLEMSKTKRNDNKRGSGDGGGGGFVTDAELTSEISAWDWNQMSGCQKVEEAAVCGGG